jgi:trk system potassium uptake protein TrkA
MVKDLVYVVVGLGAFGTNVALALADKGLSVVAIDNDADAIDQVKGKVAQALLIDADDPSFVARAPLDNVDVALVALTRFDVAILVVLYLKQVGVPRIIARAETAIHAQALKKVGADEIINVEEESGARLAHMLASPHVLDVISLSSEVSLAEVVAHNNIQNKTLEEIDVRAHFGLNVVALRRMEFKVDEEGFPLQGEILILPEDSDLVLSGDVLIVVGKPNDIDRFKEG